MNTPKIDGKGNKQKEHHTAQKPKHGTRNRKTLKSDQEMTLKMYAEDQNEEEEEEQFC